LSYCGKPRPHYVTGHPTRCPTEALALLLITQSATRCVK